MGGEIEGKGGEGEERERRGGRTYVEFRGVDVAPVTILSSVKGYVLSSRGVIQKQVVLCNNMLGGRQEGERRGKGREGRGEERRGGST